MGIFNTDELYKKRFSNSFPVGIVGGITIKEVELGGDFKDRLVIIFQNKEGDEHKEMFFGPNKDFCKTDDDYKFRCTSCMKKIMDILNLLYDKKVSIDAETWPEFVKKCLVKFKEGKPNTKMRAVFTYDKKGYLRMRSLTTKANIELDNETEIGLVIDQNDILTKPLKDNFKETDKATEVFNNALNKLQTEEEEIDDLPFK